MPAPPPASEPADEDGFYDSAREPERVYPPAEDVRIEVDKPAAEPAPSVPAANIDDLRADLAYWADVKADPEYRDQQGMSEDEVDANIAELESAIEALEEAGER